MAETTRKTTTDEAVLLPASVREKGSDRWRGIKASIVFSPSDRVNEPYGDSRVSPGQTLGAFGKRLMDIVGSAILLLASMPILLAIALLVGFTSRGAILFKQKRLGLGGREFWCYKFRTMVVDAEEQLKINNRLRDQYEQEGFKIKDDPRVTPIGGFLRKTSLDELPQFLNVLLGEMSLIGPRPIVPPELIKYGTHGAKLLTMKPGMGGLWQASGRSNVSYAERVNLDMAYIDNWSLALDIKLFFQTATSVLRTRGAY